MAKNSKFYTRRDFLKVVGATGGVAAVGCTQRPIEKIVPFVNQPDEIVPGVASWYSATCGECSASCGIIVRNREGRVVKVEGNPIHPINLGGLCARGQASLQAVYDPDRIKEPLRRAQDGFFGAVSWKEAIGQVSAKIKSRPAGKELVILTPKISGSVSKLISEFTAKVGNARHVEFELLGSDAVEEAARRTFGTGYGVRYDFSEADVVVGFGADYLETWISPVEYSRQWASRRTHNDKRQMSYVVHFEPRLSLTAANADKWVMTSVGSETDLLRGLLKSLFLNGLESAPAFSRYEANAKQMVQGIDVGEVERKAGIPNGELNALAKRLVRAKSSLVVAGGVTASGANGVSAVVLSNIINCLLGNVGRSVKVEKAKGNRDKTTHAAMQELIDLMADSKKKSVSMLIVAQVNPYYSLPRSSGFHDALANVETVVSIATHLDETSSRANLILPCSTNFESWSDSEPYSGIYNLNQPSMQPLYKTQGLGDTFISLAAQVGLELGKVSSFYDYVRENWKSRLASAGVSDFEAQWLKFLEQGGDWSKRIEGMSEVGVVQTAFEQKSNASVPSGVKGLSVLAFPSVNSLDGSSANKPWLQELPNPTTTAVWGSWAEIHPDTMKQFKISEGDVVEVRANKASVSVPVYPTKNVHPNVVALPIGQGHEAYGRYAMGVGENVLSLMGGKPEDATFGFVATGAEIFRTSWKEELLLTQGHDYQMGRGIVQSVKLSALKKVSHAHGGGDKHGGEGHENGHDTPQMYRQMEHPMYRWGMAVDLASCTGCSACVVACYAENNIPVVGRELCLEGREQSWIRIERYLDGSDSRPVGFLPMMCQHCNNAPCEPVCPVYATYHNEEGLNVMVYNRCVGTRYCSNNCSYKVRRFNWFKYNWPEPLTWQLNPDVTVREVGVMEKCTFCIQRIKEAQNNAKNAGQPVGDGDVMPACASSCPTKAITFGNLLDEKSNVFHASQDGRAYKVLEHHLNTQPAISYLARIENDT